MQKRITIFLILSLIIINSCVSSVVSPVKWESEDEGIILHLYADKKLHNESGAPEPLTFIVYQLKNPISFNAYTEKENDLNRLLKGKKYAPGVAFVKKIKVSPGSQASYTFNRAEGASHVGIVAGYNKMAKEKTTRLFSVPVFVKKENFFSFKKKLTPGCLELKVVLGPDSIKDKEKKLFKKADKKQRSEEEK